METQYKNLADVNHQLVNGILKVEYLDPIENHLNRDGGLFPSPNQHV